jgi:hypothetical protein
MADFGVIANAFDIFCMFFIIITPNMKNIVEANVI